MKKITSIIIILLVLFSVIATPVMAANEKIAKEPVKSSKAISKAPAELSGKIKAESTKADAITITKDKSGIRMKADLPKGQDKAQITLSNDVIKEILNCNGDFFYAHHFLDDGSYDGYQKVYVNKKSDTVFTAEFSETILNGFSGYEETVINNANLTDNSFTVDGADIVKIEASEVLSYSEIEEGNLTTYPDSEHMIWGSEFNGSSTAFVGDTGTDYNMAYSDSNADFNGVNSYIEVPYNNLLVGDGITVVYRVKFNDDTSQTIIAKPSVSGDYALTYNNANKLMYFFVGGNTRYEYTNNFYNEFATSKFHDIVAQTVNNSNIYLYNNLTQINEANVRTSLITNSTSDIKIGAGGYGYLNGSIDYLYLYNTSISANSRVFLHTGINGTAISTNTGSSYFGFNGSTTLTNWTGGDIEFLSTENTVVDTLTITRYFTEDSTNENATATLDNNTITVQTTNLTAGETIYQEQTTQIPLNMFYVMFGILLFLIMMSFRGIRDGVYIDNIIFCACSMLFMFYLSKLSINGSVTQIDTVISGSGDISSVYTPIINPSLNSFLELLGILFLFLLIGMIHSYIQDRKVLEE